MITRAFSMRRVNWCFRAWTDPASILARWWGPKGWTSPICEADVRPGGAWRIIDSVLRMAAADIRAAAYTAEIIGMPERLVFTNLAFGRREANLSSMDSPPSPSPSTDGRTKLRLAYARHGSGFLCRPNAQRGWRRAGRQSYRTAWRRCCNRLNRRSGDHSDSRCLTRRGSSVFQMWTDPQHIAQVVGTEGFHHNTIQTRWTLAPGGLLALHDAWPRWHRTTRTRSSISKYVNPETPSL